MANIICTICGLTWEKHSEFTRQSHFGDVPGERCRKVVQTYGTKVPDLCELPLGHEGPCNISPETVPIVHEKKVK